MRDVCGFVEMEAPFLSTNGGGRSGQTKEAGKGLTGTDVDDWLMTR